MHESIRGTRVYTTESRVGWRTGNFTAPTSFLRELEGSLTLEEGERTFLNHASSRLRIQLSLRLLACECSLMTFLKIRSSFQKVKLRGRDNSSAEIAKSELIFHEF